MRTKFFDQPLLREKRPTYRPIINMVRTKRPILSVRFSL